MDLVSVYTSQFGASLRMLEKALRLGHAQGLWTAPSPVAPFWQLGYHALFYTDIYLCVDEGAFVPRPFHRADMPRLGSLRPETPVPALKPLTDYCRLLQKQLPERLAASGFEGPSGFSWIRSFGKPELHPYNLRHLQHHTGQLAERIRAAGGPAVRWQGMQH